MKNLLVNKKRLEEVIEGMIVDNLEIDRNCPLDKFCMERPHSCDKTIFLWLTEYIPQELRTPEKIEVNLERLLTILDNIPYYCHNCPASRICRRGDSGTCVVKVILYLTEGVILRGEVEAKVFPQEAKSDQEEMFSRDEDV